MSNLFEKRKIFLGADHGGFALKEHLKSYLGKDLPQWSVQDLGCHSLDSVHYPLFAKEVAQKVAAGEGVGILVCGSGIGMSIAANKFSGVRAAEVWDVTSAHLSREHNNANILCLGGRLVGPLVAEEICKIWLNTPFEGGRHQLRLDLIHTTEKEN